MGKPSEDFELPQHINKEKKVLSFSSHFNAIVSNAEIEKSSKGYTLPTAFCGQYMYLLGKYRASYRAYVQNKHMEIKICWRSHYL